MYDDFELWEVEPVDDMAEDPPLEAEPENTTGAAEV